MKKTCLYTFIHGIKVPLGTTVRTFRPKTLQEAYDVAIKERDIFMRKNWSKQVQNSRPNNYSYPRRDYRRYDGSRDEKINRRPDFERNFKPRDHASYHPRFRDNDTPVNRELAIMPREEDRKQYSRNHGNLEKQRQIIIIIII